MASINTSTAAELVLTALKNLDEESGCSVKQVCDFVCEMQDYPAGVVRKAVEKALRAGVTFGVITRVKRGYYTLTQFEGFLKKRKRQRVQQRKEQKPEVKEIYHRKDKERKENRHKKSHESGHKCERCKHKQKEKLVKKHRHEERHHTRENEKHRHNKKGGKSDEVSEKSQGKHSSKMEGEQSIQSHGAEKQSRGENSQSLRADTQSQGRDNQSHETMQLGEDINRSQPMEMNLRSKTNSKNSQDNNEYMNEEDFECNESITSLS